MKNLFRCRIFIHPTHYGLSKRFILPFSDVIPGFVMISCNHSVMTARSHYTHRYLPLAMKVDWEYIFNIICLLLCSHKNLDYGYRVTWKQRLTRVIIFFSIWKMTDEQHRSVCFCLKTTRDIA